MSDDDSYEINEDDEEYDFEYSDDGGSSQNSEVDAENAYYNAKGMKEDGLEEAAKAFLKVVEDEEVRIKACVVAQEDERRVVDADMSTILLAAPPHQPQ